MKSNILEELKVINYIKTEKKLFQVSFILTNKDFEIISYNNDLLKLLNLNNNLKKKNIKNIFPKNILSILLEKNLKEKIIEVKIIEDIKRLYILHIPIYSKNIKIGFVNIFNNLSLIDDILLKCQKCQNLIYDMTEILESSYDGFFITDGKGVVLSVNRSWEKITGVPSRKVIGENVSDLEKKGYFSISTTKHVLKEKRRFTFKKRWFTGREVLVTANPIFDENNNITMVVSNVRDLNDIMRLARKKHKSLDSYDAIQSKLDLIKHYNLKNDEFIAESKEIIRVFELAGRVSNVDAPVIITGETGVGKEVVANYIHRNSDRAKRGPLLKVNCGAIPENLLESELFGYEGGSFTGASPGGKRGIFEAADGGTLILDEIGELPNSLQVKLLRVLQNMEIRRLGGLETIKVDVRLICITNQDLTKMIEKGEFRNDLYFRIAVVPIHIPPLRERKEDIIHLINFFVQKANERYGKSISIDREAADSLLEYEWTGNVREIQNIINYLVIVSKDGQIGLNDLPNNFHDGLYKYHLQKFESFKDAVNKFEVNYLNKAIMNYGDVKKAAVHLNMNASTIYRKLKNAKTQI